jgi:hypothetical protein
MCSEIQVYVLQIVIHAERAALSTINDDHDDVVLTHFFCQDDAIN